MKTAQRVEKHVLKMTDAYYSTLRNFCRLSKNLYNQANYMLRQAYIQSVKLPSYYELDKLLKNNTQYPDYRNMPTAQTAQQTLRAIIATWKGFLNASKEYRKNPGKFLGCPKPPKYLPKSGCFNLILTNQNCKLQNGIIRFPKVFDGFMLKTICDSRKDFKSFQQVRIVPQRNRLVIEVVYNITIPDMISDNGRCIGVDLGVNNLASPISMG